MALPLSSEVSLREKGGRKEREILIFDAAGTLSCNLQKESRGG